MVCLNDTNHVYQQNGHRIIYVRGTVFVSGKRDWMAFHHRVLRTSKCVLVIMNKLKIKLNSYVREFHQVHVTHRLHYRNLWRIPLKFVGLFRCCGPERLVHIHPGKDTEGNLKHLWCKSLSHLALNFIVYIFIFEEERNSLKSLCKVEIYWVSLNIIYNFRATFNVIYCLLECVAV
jgi:hypothetical protein